jgi:hypothetical protein
MSNVTDTQRRPATGTFAARRSAVSALAAALGLAVTMLATGTASAQSPRSTPLPSPVQATAPTTRAAGPDLQGLWDFTMRVGERTSTGFFALGPLDGAWAGSLTPDSTNTLANRLLTVHGDSIRMVVASREGDVPFHARLSADARTMEGIVEYHGGARLPMTATRRARGAVSRY